MATLQSAPWNPALQTHVPAPEFVPEPSHFPPVLSHGRHCVHVAP
jgi:hypothetical protein